MSHRFLEHTADVKFVAEGATIEEAFSSAADAMAETVRGDIKILEQEAVSFEVEGTDLGMLLYNFLEEFLFLLDAQDFLMAKVTEIKIDAENFKLSCTIVGDKAENYKFTNDVKAITYSDMFVEKGDGGWKVQAVLDV
ncbi:archease [archaeon]|jgi:SHS2 domain-containing protein|nr:archease [archaeon]MBT3577839.1 archease [archaeon]MBT6820190.1 archease [archaeon]MBT6955779.1 archease [archaeon]MBT7025301.1 archease [archaeon]